MFSLNNNELHGLFVVPEDAGMLVNGAAGPGVLALEELETSGKKERKKIYT